MTQKYVSIVRCDATCNVKYTNLSADPALDIPLPIGWSTVNGKDFCPTHTND